MVTPGPREPRRQRAALAACAAAAALSACAGSASDPAAARPRDDVRAAWIEYAPLPQARAVVDAGTRCPVLQLDGRDVPMQLRVAAGTAPQRAAPPHGEPSKPAAFAVQVCEAAVPAGTAHLRVGERTLAAPHDELRRIVVIGDTGCRSNGEAFQKCSDPDWPFARVAAAAAAVAPDLVIHVGDYHYRETPCPAGRDDCRNAPWGYGWDAWQADFFDPAAPLLAAAPWVVVRGNHETCARAGQGWFRLLAPEPYRPQRNCDDPGADGDADFSPPYAVALGALGQLIVFDSAHAGNAPLDRTRADDDRTFRTYVAQLQDVAALGAPPGVARWFVSHHPVLGYAPDLRHPRTPHPGNPALQSALRSVFGDAYFPPEVQLALHGHVHLFQAIGFASAHPATLVAGNGGDTLDAPLPQPPDDPPAPFTQVAQITQASSFGFLVLERSAGAPHAWSVRALRSDASTLARCTLSADRALSC